MSEILIVGGDSTIGSRLVALFEANGDQVVSTTCFQSNLNDRCFFLDLSDDLESWPMPSAPIKTAIICAAITSQEQCRLDPELSRRVNVKGTVTLAKRLVEAGIFVIFLSSSAVFNGEFPYAKPNEPTTPCTEYGRQKVEAEDQLLKLGNNVAIVRFSKVIGPEMPLLIGWIRALNAGQVIHPFYDMFIAPVSVTFAVSVLHEIARIQASGIVQVSAKQDVTYSDLARYIAIKLGFDEKLIQPISYCDAGFTYASRNATLDTSRLSNLGMQAPDVWAELDETIKLIGLNSA